MTTTTTVFPSRHVVPIRAFQCSDIDIDGFAKRMVYGEALKDAWRSTNDGFKQFLYEAKKVAERVNRRFSISRCPAPSLASLPSPVARTAANRAREIDREFEIGVRWHTFSLDFTRNLPRVSCLSLSALWLLFGLKEKLGSSLSGFFFFMGQVWIISIPYPNNSGIIHTIPG
ncbi:hypothetical protein SO802_023194 [Lithocarpus litseifolius]|uniref:Uncharacterized protein n=1 Tax=Lithocarpus litseifolius TaxID=425828 RepID=A0AAW2C6Z8_9ROSI